MGIKSDREVKIVKVTLIGSIVNVLLLILKFIAGIMGHSAAMIADAVHSLSDFITDIIVILFIRISGKPQDEGHDYGHGKYETLATALIGIILFGIGIGILVSGTKSVVAFINGEELPAPHILAFVMAGISILVKEILYQYTIKKGRTLNSKALGANAWHHRSDALSSIGTFIGIGGAIFLGAHWRVLDPLAAIVVSAFIITASVKLIKPCFDELMEHSLPHEEEAQILDIVCSFPEISSPHNLRTRRIGNHIAIEIHIRMDGNMSLTESHALTKKIEILLKEKFGEDTHIGIHAEPVK